MVVCVRSKSHLRDVRIWFFTAPKHNNGITLTVVSSSYNHTDNDYVICTATASHKELVKAPHGPTNIKPLN